MSFAVRSLQESSLAGKRVGLIGSRPYSSNPRVLRVSRSLNARAVAVIKKKKHSLTRAAQHGRGTVVTHDVHVTCTCPSSDPCGQSQAVFHNCESRLSYRCAQLDRVSQRNNMTPWSILLEFDMQAIKDPYCYELNTRVGHGA